ncbi:MAG: hypothetical protein NT033_05985 [Candidatus Omnitrophica bacterium]|nr:hypothetical protein [Candidatus Omnitrophota bacterium]
MRSPEQFYAKTIQLPFKIKRRVLALGGQTKNTLCFARGDFAFLSPEQPDLNNPEDYHKFEAWAKHFFKKHPQAIAYDLHPEYQSTKYALALSVLNYQLVPVQHHHAHIASCMAQNGLKNQKVIGVAFDGTGLGQDSTIWGAEFIICDYATYRRVGHLREIPLLGGERAIIEPWRLAAVWLYLAYKDEFWKLKLDFVRALNKKKWRVLKNMYLAGYNSPLASSMGRLFDAAASLTLARTQVAFEAELAIGLEKLAAKSALSSGTAYKFNLTVKKGVYVLDPLPIFKGIISDLRAKKRKEDIAYKFHLTAAQMLKKTCLGLRRKYGLNSVVLSGGVFQNKLLLRLSLDLLYKEGFKVITAKNISCNDSGISLGQAIIAGIR